MRMEFSIVKTNFLELKTCLIIKQYIFSKEIKIFQKIS